MPRKPLSDAVHTVTALRRDAVEIPTLEVVAAPPGAQPLRAVLGLAPIVVGKSDDADLQIVDTRVSRQHCSFMLTPQGVVLRDLGSKNGTFVGGARIVEAILPVGVTVLIGSTPLSIMVAGAPSALPLSSSPRFGAALGTTVVMRALFAQLERAAKTSETVLLLGESGTGKELLAHAVHEASARKGGPFAVFDASSVAPPLVESELFGYVRGAFTGAADGRAGILEHASGNVGKHPL